MALVEGVDYYLERGLMVFTAAYLRKRGYCCESGCRHCPYGYVKPKPGEKPAAGAEGAASGSERDGPRP